MIPSFIFYAFAVSFLGAPAALASPAPPETHSFKVVAKVEYRCYGGYDKKKIAKDSVTGAVCDNKTVQSKLIDKVVPITIKFEPNPDDEQTLAGSWSEEGEFMGHRYFVAITLFKEDPKGKPRYRARFVGGNHDPQTRESATFTEFASPKQMNALELEFSSRGTPEEIRFHVSVTAG